MKLSDILSQYSRIFNILGENIIIFNSTPTLTRRILTFLLACISLASNVCLLSVNIFFEIEWIEFHVDDVDISVHEIFFIIIVFARITVLRQIFFSSSTFTRFFTQFKQLERITGSKFEMNFDQFQSFYLRRVITVILLWFLSLLISTIAVPGTYLDMVFGIGFLSMTLLNRISCCHALYYLCVIRFCFKEFQYYVREKRPKTITIVKSELLFMKLVHFKLWEIAATFNILFGWILSALFLLHFVDCVNRLYWIFMFMHRDGDFVTSLRKYLFNVRLLFLFEIL